MKLRWLFWLLALIFVWLIVSQFAQIEQLVLTLATGQSQWVIAAALLQIIYYLFYTSLYQSAFNTVEVKSRTRELLPITLASIYVNVTTPSAGRAALFADDAARRGESASQAAVGSLLVLVADTGTFSIVLLIGLFYLFQHHHLQLYEVAGSVILFLFIGGLAGILLLGLWQPILLSRVLNWVQHNINRLSFRLHRPQFLADNWAEKNSNEFTQAAMAITAHPRRLQRTLVIGLAAHLANLLSLFTLFLAFHQRVGVGILVAGYVIGILFWIVSITPQGIGVVEGVMTLVFSSLGVPIERAAVIALTFRGLTFWLPMAIGFFTLRRIGSFRARPQKTRPIFHPPDSVRLVAVLTALMGVINVISAITPSLPDRLNLLMRFPFFEIRHGGRLTVALAGFALLILAGSLWRRKRAAWMLVEIILVLSVFTHLIKGLDYEEALLSLGLAVWLFALQPNFHARSDPPSIRQGLQTLGFALVFTLFYGVAGFYLLDHQFRVNFGLADAIRQTIIMFTQFYDPGLEPITGLGRYFGGSIYAVGGITIGYALLMLARPVLTRAPAKPEERLLAQQIVETYGHSSLVRLVLMDDKHFFFSPGGSVIAFVPTGRIALTLGDPIGPAEDNAAAIGSFQAYCEHNDWLPTFYQVLPEHTKEYEAAGFNLLCIGNEAIVDVPNFTMQGNINKGLRSAYNRLVRLGFEAIIHPAPISKDLLNVLRQISDEWLTMMNGTEKRFSLGWFDEDYIASCPIIAIHSPQGEVMAFANIVRENQANEITIDLMRYRKNSEHGLMDFLFGSLLQWAKEQNYATCNLGLSALAGIGEGPNDPMIEQALHYIYEHVTQFYNFKGLHEFKDKFHPVWSPRYLVYPGISSLPLVAIALLRADSGGDVFESYLRRP